MNIQRLPWDTDFFGINIGKVVIYENVDFDPIRLLQQANDEKYELVYVFKYQKMLNYDKVIKANLDLIDIQLTMSKKFFSADYIKLPYTFKTELTIKERNECYKIAEKTSIVSRFYNEEKIGPQKTNQLYRKWIDNALNKSFSDGLFLVKKSCNISGIHLIKTDIPNKTGYFTLTGVDSEYKRMGFGKELWLQSLAYWANESEIDQIKSTLSIQNAESLNFHMKMGFNKIEEIKYIYHFRNKIK